MRLGLLHKEEGKVGIAHLLQLDGDGGHEQEVGVAVARIAQIFRMDAMIGELEAKVPRDIDQGFLGGEPQRRRLGPHASGQGGEALADGFVDIAFDLVGQFTHGTFLSWAAGQGIVHAGSCPGSTAREARGS